MSEYDITDYCPECENFQVFTLSGSSKKAVCNGCEVKIETVDKSFKRLVVTEYKELWQIK